MSKPPRQHAALRKWSAAWYNYFYFFYLQFPQPLWMLRTYFRIQRTWIVWEYSLMTGPIFIMMHGDYRSIVLASSALVIYCTYLSGLMWCWLWWHGRSCHHAALWKNTHTMPAKLQWCLVTAQLSMSTPSPTKTWPKGIPTSYTICQSNIVHQHRQIT